MSAEHPAEHPAEYDLVIRNGQVVDGSGAPAVRCRRGREGRQDRAGRPRRGPRGRRDRRRRPAGDAGLRGHPHPLRRTGHLGPADGPQLLAWRDHGGDGQLRRRLRPGEAVGPRGGDRTDGRRGGHPRRLPARRPGLELGKLRRLPRRAGRAALRHGHLRPVAARPAARVRDGRTRAAAGERHARGHRAHARAGCGCHARRRLRLHHLAHHQPQDGEGRPHADAAGAGRRAHRHRHGPGRRRPRADRVRLGLGPARPGRRIRHAAPAGRTLGPQLRVLAEPAPRRTQHGMARTARAVGPRGGRRPADAPRHRTAPHRLAVRIDRHAEPVLGDADLPLHRRAAAGRTRGAHARPGDPPAHPGRRSVQGQQLPAVRAHGLCADVRAHVPP